MRPHGCPVIAAGVSMGNFGGNGSQSAQASWTSGTRFEVDVVAVWSLQNLGLANRALQNRAQAEVGEADAERARVADRIREEVGEAFALVQARRSEFDIALRRIENAGKAFDADMINSRNLVGRPNGATIEVLRSLDLLTAARPTWSLAHGRLQRSWLRLYMALRPITSHAPLNATDSTKASRRLGPCGDAVRPELDVTSVNSVLQNYYRNARRLKNAPAGVGTPISWVRRSPQAVGGRRAGPFRGTRVHSRDTPWHNGPCVRLWDVPHMPCRTCRTPWRTIRRLALPSRPAGKRFARLRRKSRRNRCRFQASSDALSCRQRPCGSAMMGTGLALAQAIGTGLGALVEMLAVMAAFLLARRLFAGRCLSTCQDKHAERRQLDGAYHAIRRFMVHVPPGCAEYALQNSKSGSSISAAAYCLATNRGRPPNATAVLVMNSEADARLLLFLAADGFDRGLNRLQIL